MATWRRHTRIIANGGRSNSLSYHVERNYRSGYAASPVKQEQAHPKQLQYHDHAGRRHLRQARRQVWCWALALESASTSAPGMPSRSGPSTGTRKCASCRDGRRAASPTAARHPQVASAGMIAASRQLSCEKERQSRQSRQREYDRGDRLHRNQRFLRQSGGVCCLLGVAVKHQMVVLEQARHSRTGLAQRLAVTASEAQARHSADRLRQGINNCRSRQHRHHVNPNVEPLSPGRAAPAAVRAAEPATPEMPRRQS